MTWSATQYLRFEDERTRPARDLLAQVPLKAARRVVDLGCGPGNSTALLVERFGEEAVSGMDSDADMLAEARRRLPAITFLQADLAGWAPSSGTDLLFANAVFQWIPDHLTVLARLLESLPTGGVLAVQMPDNLDEPTHLLMEETARSGSWAEACVGLRRPTLPAPADYYDRLSPLSQRLDIWHTIYQHPMADGAAIVEWVKGTGLRPYLRAAGAQQESAFLADYGSRIDAAYPPRADGRRLLRFPRLFLVATRA
ncbi:trans-aconitate 2-methyltransferase [Xaviernesmea oryzae]|uniref:Trans-aconitate 2-methyltransferase n=1 Tax=Xaviernesmea oryzae TaxID=464029 RepID=A0A1Q9B3X0_9HYPH|nr:trans-aconitate 2-methyltransferase [Xaviernesmea oryzae]OLP62720.1 trans-aconitate 2-methyltransferase [Xaviernesmea oryzae]SEM38167.1 trans-aconitate 2-methyltransferase [Xaviernesmea oryzae]